MLSSLDKLNSNLTEFLETKKYVENFVSGVSIDDDELAAILADLPTDLDDFGDDEDADRYNINNVDNYREHPYESPSLTAQQNEKVMERMKLLPTDESTPMNILTHVKDLMIVSYLLKNSFTVR